MRIDKLEVRNFKKFAEQTFDFHPQFTLLVGENGAGKTSVLDALSVALGVWLVHVPDSQLANSRRKIAESEIRIQPEQDGDRVQFREATTGVVVQATGTIQDTTDLTWSRSIKPGKKETSNAGSHQAMRIISEAFAADSASERVILPVLAYYGAGRAWLAHRDRYKSKSKPNGPARRWAAFYDCLNERIRLSDLSKWFQAEAIAKGNRGGRYRPGFEVVKQAVLRCVPDSNDIWYDGDREELVLSIAGHAQPLSNLSAGQTMMLALVADIAIKAVMQNNFLVPPDVLTSDDEPLPRVLAETPGVILIDELDVHLHPRWQRRVATDLKTTFPNMQFVCTSHSPQVIGEVLPDELRLLDGDRYERPAQSFGMDSNWILRVLMDAEDQDGKIKSKLDSVFDLIGERNLEEATNRISALRQEVGNSEAIQRAQSTIERVRILGK